jgi:hypothetical protein
LVDFKINLAPGGIEPTTFALLARRSNQLSYGASWVIIDLGFSNLIQL